MGGLVSTSGSGVADKVLHGAANPTLSKILKELGRLGTFPGDDIGAQNNLQRLFHLDKKRTTNK
ncbi:MAG: hypothetical protein HW402_1554 [Dehalococcoidales bacterium]|nr:hypothetical protein [Dehalococcoidales bacterium]